jgi:hypothetical protein|nr:MAG TPA: hypothetical protein [Caudoviricetes sp.]
MDGLVCKEMTAAEYLSNLAMPRNYHAEVTRVKTRNMSYEDHGVFPGDEKELLIRCRKADREERHNLLHACIDAAPEGLEFFVYQSLASGKSYDNISRTDYIPAKKDDFYAYRRKAMGTFYNLLRMEGKWNQGEK